MFCICLHVERNGSTVGQCIIYLWASTKLMSQSGEVFYVYSLSDVSS